MEPKTKAMIPMPELIPGDCLLYRPSTFFGWVIAVKTWNSISHVEVFAGNNTSVASRDGKGVNLYTFRKDDLAAVLRPRGGFNFAQAMEWFEKTAKGQGYDWLGILCFSLAIKRGSPDKMFCSEFATNFYRAGGFEPFQSDYSADHVAPANFLISEPMQEIWMDK